MKHTNHTALMITAGHQGNTAMFVVGHPVVVNKTDSFTNSIFKTDECVAIVVRFRMSETKRYLVSAHHITGSDVSKIADSHVDYDERTKAALEWVSANASTLYKEAVSYAIEHSQAPQGLQAGQGISRELTFTLEGNVYTNGNGTSIEVNGVDGAEAAVMVESVRSSMAIFADGRSPLSTINSISEKTGMFVKRGDWELFDAMRNLSKDGAANVLMIGPSGTGKTSIPTAFAMDNGMKVFTIDCATIRDPEEWFGYREAKDGSTLFQKSLFVKAVEDGDTIIILDEFNRIEPWLHNSIYALLDHRRETNVHGETIKVGKGTIFVATANLGSAFTGTFTLDAALTNRFDATIITAFLDAKVEAKLLANRVGLDEKSNELIVKVMAFLRGMEKRGVELPIDISTRTALKIALLVKHSKLPFRKILDYTIMSLIEDPTLAKGIMDGITPLISSPT